MRLGWCPLGSPDDGRDDWRLKSLPLVLVLTDACCYPSTLSMMTSFFLMVMLLLSVIFIFHVKLAGEKGKSACQDNNGSQVMSCPNLIEECSTLRTTLQHRLSMTTEQERFGKARTLQSPFLQPPILCNTSTVTGSHHS